MTDVLEAMQRPLAMTAKPGGKNGGEMSVGEVIEMRHILLNPMQPLALFIVVFAQLVTVVNGA